MLAKPGPDGADSRGKRVFTTVDTSAEWSGGVTLRSCCRRPLIEVFGRCPRCSATTQR